MKFHILSWSRRYHANDIIPCAAEFTVSADLETASDVFSTTLWATFLALSESTSPILNKITTQSKMNISSLCEENKEYAWFVLLGEFVVGPTSPRIIILVELGLDTVGRFLGGAAPHTYNANQQQQQKRLVTGHLGWNQREKCGNWIIIEKWSWRYIGEGEGGWVEMWSVIFCF